MVKKSAMESLEKALSKQVLCICEDTPTPEQTRDNVLDCCIFCHSNEDDVDKLGQMHRSHGITVHYFCMLFASGLVQSGRTLKSGIMGFMHNDIMKEARRASRLKCTYCKTIGATIGCVTSRCRVVFHLPCGLKNNALNQYMGEYRSYCEAHRPEQEMPNKSEDVPQNVSNSVCIMCMNQLEMRPSNTVLYTPCCKNSWFHRDCLQRHAISSGLHFFRCPLCNDKDLFQKEMLKFGIYIPDQDAAWEREPNAFQDLLIRHSQCDVKCICPYGPKYKKESSKWDLMLCDWCGSSGTHVACSQLKTALDPWVCKDCHQICGNDMKKSAEKANQTCHQAVVEQRKYRRSVHGAESCSKKKYPSTTNTVADAQRSMKWSQSGRKSSVGRPNRRRKISQPLVSDHVVLGSRLKDWTPEERQFGCQAQIHLTRMTSDMILKAKAALSKHTRKSNNGAVRYWQISIREAFARKQNTQKMSGTGPNSEAQVNKEDVTENTRNCFADIRKQTRTAVTGDNDSPVAMKRGHERLADDSVNAASIIHDGACASSSTMARCTGEGAAGESAQQMVSPLTRKRAAEMLEVPVTPVMDKDGSSFTACEAKMSRSAAAATPTQKARIVPASINSGSNTEANDFVPFLTNDCSTPITVTYDIAKADVTSSADEASCGEKDLLLVSRKRSLSYPEFVNKYFQTKSVTLYTKLMHYQSYLRLGLLPEIAEKRIT